MSLPALQQNATSYPGSPADGLRNGHGDFASGAQSADITKRRAVDDQRRLRRVKDSREQLKSRTRAQGSSGTIDTLTSSSTGAGRSYTVANVHNGVIYLRPTVRAGNQRGRPQPDPFVFPPQTPPDSATLDSHLLRPASNEWEQSLYGSRTPRSEPTPPPPLPILRPDDADRPLAHARSHSFSTADDHTVTSLGNEPGTFKVVIERTPFGRPKTADTSSFPLLQVPIPTYKLGTPRFSTRGTADLRSSVYTRASAAEDGAHSLLSRPHSDAYSPIPHRYRATMERPPMPTSAPSSARVSHMPIGPRLYDALTANPDDHAVVRFSPTGEILAATPSRLVAHITSPSFLDYELLSDFFLTFRAFLSTRDLVAYLISRLRWAVDRQDDFGRIVRVRTFVALRHWILNYFVDDFVPDFHLRTFFCDLVNSLYRDLRNREDGGGGDVKIVGELKKCWRRTCAMYWETEDGIGQNSVDEELLPGGQADSQTSGEEYITIARTPTTPKRPNPRDTKETVGSNPSDQFASRHMEWAQRARHTPQNSMSSPYVPSQEYETAPVPLSPASEQSMHVLSCSIPMRGMNKTEQGIELPLYPHPVPAGTARLAASPQQATSAKKMNRPVQSHAHKRSGSFSDALRDSRAPLSLPKHTSAETAASVVSNMPGSLVRGGLFQPGSPFIELKSLRHARSHVQLEVDDAIAEDVEKPVPPSSPGMKKIFGSVRRALSTRQAPGPPPYLSSHAHHRQPRSAHSSSSGPISTASGGVQKRRITRGRPQVRIDLLASQVAESFKEAVREQLENEGQQRHSANPPDLGGFEFEFDKRNTPVSDDRKESVRRYDPRVQSNITSGSKSILIIDDTGAPPLPTMSGALPGQTQDSVPDNAPAEVLQRSISIDEHTNHGSIHAFRHSELYNDPETLTTRSEHRQSRTNAQRPAARRRRSMSEGREPEQMHSFRRRGSTKTSMARTGSLRRHASYNSVLSRRRGPDSVSTFQTMSSNNDPFFLDQPAGGSAAPTRQLRRRPGGDLRAVDNVHDLEYIQRPHSTGSVSNRTHSVTNSVILRSDRYIDPSPEPIQRAGKAELEPQLEREAPPKKSISLVDTHSSQPNLRPSFEAEVAKLAALPDDTDDEGGVESALMKLEGRYEKRSSSDSSRRTTAEMDEYRPIGAPGEYASSDNNPSEYNTHDNTDDVLHRPLAPPAQNEHDMYRLSAENFNRRMPAVSSEGGSEDSYSSIPLLDRGLSDMINTGHTGTLETMRSSAKPSPLQLATNSSHQTTHTSHPTMSSNSSLEYVVETDSMKRISAGATRPRSSVLRESFLLDEDEDLSDMDTIGGKSDSTSHGVRSFFDDEPATVERDSKELPTHPMRHPPTPPMTAHRLNDALPNPTVFERGLPTPGLTPTAPHPHNQTFESPMHTLNSSTESHNQPERSTTPATHMPFVLAYDSEILAQQFTVVEKDALDEIDWKELIELRWKQSSPQIRDWVHYLRTEEARGVDVVIARFNLVVKWVVSECVLTEDTHERARCIVKYIHIAAHARRLRNYATMYQISIALISNDVSKLRRTWALIPAAELQVLKELEAIVQPLKNFHNLRLEMETATVDDGCIPFIGIYTRDLIYNAQKPAFIDSPPVDGERLVNFERHHTAATIVKNLLRLLEASSKYTFKVEPHIISKCLWLAALTDDEISKRSRLCE
ncbi:ras GEF [Ophiobolus disseminans]|uniref:Ras GEF n=1 Tax=Ophiobolus disseminans TaxID=1469910 RepID=A0A6A6ZEQ2_9PLEO|nr:ras GEF [Ophiobolus disseminans]